MSDADRARAALDDRWERPWMKPNARNRIGVALVYAILDLADALRAHGRSEDAATDSGEAS